MYLDTQVLVNDTISFYRKVSSENGYDFLNFYVDGILLGSWSGNLDWDKVSYPVAAGIHRFSWVYEKDEATSSGDDAAWIDYIEFPLFDQKLSGPLSVKTAVVHTPICPGIPTQLCVFASGDAGDYSYKWSPESTLSSSGIFNPVATPTETTTYHVRVNTVSASATKEITVFVEPVPATPVVSVSEDHLISSATEGNRWYNSHGLIPGATAQEYYPPVTESYYVKTISTKGCMSAASTEFEYAKPPGENGVSAHPNPFTDKLFFEYSLQSSGSVKILIYNSIGNQAGTLDEGVKSAGYHTALFDSSQLAPGIYYCKIYSTDGVSVVKVIKHN
jgi:hypothetical protein